MALTDNRKYEWVNTALDYAKFELKLQMKDIFNSRMISFDINDCNYAINDMWFGLLILILGFIVVLISSLVWQFVGLNDTTSIVQNVSVSTKASNTMFQLLWQLLLVL